jgi:hypothetical protein
MVCVLHVHTLLDVCLCGGQMRLGCVPYKYSSAQGRKRNRESLALTLAGAVLAAFIVASAWVFMQWNDAKATGRGVGAASPSLPDYDLSDADWLHYLTNDTRLYSFKRNIDYDSLIVAEALKDERAPYVTDKYIEFTAPYLHAHIIGSTMNSTTLYGASISMDRSYYDLMLSRHHNPYCFEDRLIIGLIANSADVRIRSLLRLLMTVARG